MRAGSWRLCRSILPRNCCIRKVLPVLLHPEVLPVLPSQVLPLPLLGSEFLASSQSGYLLLGSEFSSFSAEQLPAELVKLVTSTSTHVELVISTSTQGVLWLACITRVLLPSQEGSVRCRPCVPPGQFHSIQSRTRLFSHDDSARMSRRPPNVHSPLVVSVYQVSCGGISIPCSSFSLGSARGLPDRVASCYNLHH